MTWRESLLQPLHFFFHSAKCVSPHWNVVIKQAKLMHRYSVLNVLSSCVAPASTPALLILLPVPTSCAHWYLHCSPVEWSQIQRVKCLVVLSFEPVPSVTVWLCMNLDASLSGANQGIAITDSVLSACKMTVVMIRRSTGCLLAKSQEQKDNNLC